MTQQEQDEKSKQEFKEFLNKGDNKYFMELSAIPYYMGEFIWLASRRTLRKKEPPMDENKDRYKLPNALMDEMERMRTYIKKLESEVYLEEWKEEELAYEDKIKELELQLTQERKDKNSWLEAYQQKVRELESQLNVEKPERTGCGICGGTMAEIRGRYPHTEKRLVCPTCLQERLEIIHDETSPDYGKACQEAEEK